MKGKGKIMKGEVEIVPNVKLDLDVQSDDVVSIYVAAEEERLLKIEADLGAEQEKIVRRNAEIEVIVSKLVVSHGEKVATEMKRLAEKAFKILRMKMRTSVHSDLHRVKGKDVVRVTLEVGVSSKTGEGEIRMSRAVAVPKRIRDLKAELEANRKRLEAVRSELSKVRHDLVNIPRLERKARAKLGTAVLSSSVQGQRLLDTVMTKRLPAPKE